jgi:isoquinoline 1-oxidoreductase alpha subunit
MTSFRLNGKAVSVDVDPEKPLLWVIRENAGLTGTKYGCGKALCGACTVHIDGEVQRSCSVPVSDVEGKSVLTVEGLSNDRSHKLQQAWIEHAVPQCGYCQSGMLMAAAGFLATHSNPSDADIDAAITNICRCGTYHRIRAAIKAAAAA